MRNDFRFWCSNRQRRRFLRANTSSNLLRQTCFVILLYNTVLEPLDPSLVMCDLFSKVSALSSSSQSTRRLGVLVRRGRPMRLATSGSSLPNGDPFGLCDSTLHASPASLMSIDRWKYRTTAVKIAGKWKLVSAHHVSTGKLSVRVTFINFSLFPSDRLEVPTTKLNGLRVELTPQNHFSQIFTAGILAIHRHMHSQTALARISHVKLLF